MKLSINLHDGVRINAAQLETIQGAFLNEGISCDVYPDTGNTVTAVPAGEEPWTGHVMDGDGDYLFPTVAVSKTGVHNVPQTTKCNWKDV